MSHDVDKVIAPQEFESDPISVLGFSVLSFVLIEVLHDQSRRNRAQA